MHVSASIPQVAEPPAGTGVLAVAAHPDDIESWCGGTLARMIQAGVPADYLLLTSGDKGSEDPTHASGQLASLCEEEQLEAARRLGARGVHFLRHLDGELEDSLKLREQVVRCLRELRPEIVFTHDPERPYPPYTTHRDHRIAGRVTLDAIYPAARDRRSFPEHHDRGLQPHKVRQVWLFASAAPDTWVDIADGFDRKLLARLAHTSQTADPEDLRKRWRERAERIGAPVGLALAEAFVVLQLD